MPSLAPTISSQEQTALMDRLRVSQHRVWGYVRVSSDKQEDNQSPEVQITEITTYAAARGLASRA